MITLIHQRDRAASDKVIFSKLTLPFSNAPTPDTYGIEPLKCIPAGIYTCIPYHSPHRDDDCWLLQDILGFSFVEIHSGNFACEVMLQSGLHKPDSEGCLMYGFGIEENVPMITRSKDAIAYLHNIIGLKTTFEIDVRD